MPVAAAHERFSRICHVARMSTPPKKTVALAIPLSCMAPAISAFCWSTTQTPSITISLVAIVHTKPVIANLVRKLVTMAMPIRTSKSATSSTDKMTTTKQGRIQEFALGALPHPLLPLRSPSTRLDSSVVSNRPHLRTLVVLRCAK